MMNLDDPGWLKMIHDAILLENFFCFNCFLSILHTRPFDASPRKGWDKSLINFTSPTTLPQQVYTRIQACHKKIPSQSFSWLARPKKITMLASVNLIPSYCLVSLLLVLLWSGQTGVPHWNTNTKVPSLWGKYFKIFAQNSSVDAVNGYWQKGWLKGQFDTKQKDKLASSKLR